MIIICPRAASRRRRDCSGPDRASSSGSHPASPSGRPAATGSASRPSLSRSSAPSLHYRNTPRHGSCSPVAGSSASAPRTGSACSPETPLLLLLLLRGHCSCRCPDSRSTATSSQTGTGTGQTDPASPNATLNTTEYEPATGRRTDATRRSAGTKRKRSKLCVEGTRLRGLEAPLTQFSFVSPNPSVRIHSGLSMLAGQCAWARRGRSESASRFV